jgi:hypothetical protein
MKELRIYVGGSREILVTNEADCGALNPKLGDAADVGM